MKIICITGEKQAGKTTYLIDFFENISDTERPKWSGIITPIIEEKRHFLLYPHFKFINLENTDNQEDALNVGKYIFSKKTFMEAENYLKSMVQKGKSKVVLDEIGKLEYEVNQGFHHLLIWLLEQPLDELILVLRKEIYLEIKEKYNITDSQDITI